MLLPNLFNTDSILYKHITNNLNLLKLIQWTRRTQYKTNLPTKLCGDPMWPRLDSVFTHALFFKCLIVIFVRWEHALVREAHWHHHLRTRLFPLSVNIMLIYSFITYSSCVTHTANSLEQRFKTLFNRIYEIT